VETESIKQDGSRICKIICLFLTKDIDVDLIDILLETDCTKRLEDCRTTNILIVVYEVTVIELIFFSTQKWEGQVSPWPHVFLDI
jgi:hypothetical protein